MISEASNKNELLNEIGEAINQMTGLMSALDEKKINTVPYEDSWTAGQLLRHVTKSINGMAKAIGSEAKPADRNEGERIPELKKIFLDFNSKMKSPEFIVPENDTYEKSRSIEELNRSFEGFKGAAEKANVTDMVEGLPLGPITKLEILHFVLYHTQRHLHQMKKIGGALEKK